MSLIEYETLEKYSIKTRTRDNVCTKMAAPMELLPVSVLVFSGKSRGSKLLFFWGHDSAKRGNSSEVTCGSHL